MGIKVKLDVQLWIPTWKDEPEVWVCMHMDRPIAPDHMLLETLTVELPVSMPTEKEISAYRTKVERTSLLAAKKEVEEKLKRIENQLNQEFRDTYEIRWYERVDDIELGGR